VVLVALLALSGGQRHVEAEAQSVTIQWGPYTVPAASGGTPGSTDNLADFGVAMPCTDCYITSITPDLVYPDGSSANMDTMAMLHHMVAFGQPMVDPTCSGYPWDFLGQRFFASGNERSVMTAPAGYGFYNPWGANWNLVVDIMNMMEMPRDMYLKFTFTYEPAAGSGLKPVTPVWLDVMNCGSSEYAIDPGYSDTHWDWTSTLTGDIVSIGGHVHGFGINISAQRAEDGTYICNSMAHYEEGSAAMPAPVAPGDEGHPPAAMSMPPEGEMPMNGVMDMSGCAPLFRINAGETVRLHSRYNAPTAHDDVMGIMVAYIYETTEPVPDADDDSVRDELDNCPDWPNESQAMPPWQVPADDSDCDAYSTADETAFGTDPATACGFTSGGDLASENWPPDLFENNTINTTDVLQLKPIFLQAVPPASARYDLFPNGTINTTDVLQLKPQFLFSCTP
jgi:hypothetical protein